MLAGLSCAVTKQMAEMRSEERFTATLVYVLGGDEKADTSQSDRPLDQPSVTEGTEQ